MSKWVTKEGEVLEIKSMSTEHIINALRHLLGRREDTGVSFYTLLQELLERYGIRNPELDRLRRENLAKELLLAEARRLLGPLTEEDKELLKEPFSGGL